MTTYLVHRTETIYYVKTYTREELIELGCPPRVFEDGDLAADFHDEVSSRDRSFHDALIEDTERHGDVEGSTFTIKERA